jgi:hypothetical protein
MIGRKKIGNLLHIHRPILFINDWLGHSDLIVVFKDRLAAPLPDECHSHLSRHRDLGDAALMLESKD